MTALLLLAVNSVYAAEPLKLPVPAGWRTEDTTYPPPWARQLPWKGTLQLRFPPGFFKPADPYFWSYPILYQLEGDVLASDKDLERALREYDAGLYGGQFPADRIKLTIKTLPKTKKQKAAGYVRRVVVFEGFDPFQTKKPLTTHLVVSRWYRPEQKHTVVLILRSPRKPAEADPIWKTLSQFQSVITP